jgi:Raf kinase inhibitor-like YbhB/YbcL family protein
MKSIRIVLFLLIPGILLLIAGCSSQEQQIPSQPVQTHGQGSFAVSSGLFSEGGILPEAVSCAGAGTAPGLSWKNPPEGTKSFVLILEDPDAPRGIFTHWIVYNIPSSAGNLTDTLPDQAETGLNSAGSRTYAPPCPPKGTTHRYIFSLYALDSLISPRSYDRSSVLEAMQGHVLGTANITPVFRR